MPIQSDPIQSQTEKPHVKDQAAHFLTPSAPLSTAAQLELDRLQTTLPAAREGILLARPQTSIAAAAAIDDHIPTLETEGKDEGDQDRKKKKLKKKN